MKGKGKESLKFYLGQHDLNLGCEWKSFIFFSKNKL